MAREVPLQGRFGEWTDGTAGHSVTPGVKFANSTFFRGRGTAEAETSSLGAVRQANRRAFVDVMEPWAGR
jgi:hypothetical protein